MPFELTLTENCALLQSFIVARDKACDELGSELQDNVSQLLASAQVLIQQAAAKQANAGESLQKGLLHLNIAMNEVRKISQALSSSVVQDLGLEAAIDTLLEAAPATIKTYLDFEAALEQLLSPALKLMVYRIVQEQLSNIYRHADAGGLSIELRRKEQQLCLTISDDGKGFPAKQPRKGMGFDIIQNRVAAIHGSFSVQSAPGNGCQLFVRIPLPAAALQQSFSYLSPLSGQQR